MFSAKYPMSGLQYSHHHFPPTACILHGGQGPETNIKLFICLSLRLQRKVGSRHVSPNFEIILGSLRWPHTSQVVSGSLLVWLYALAKVNRDPGRISLLFIFPLQILLPYPALTWVLRYRIEFWSLGEQAMPSSPACFPRMGVANIQSMKDLEDSVEHLVQSYPYSQASSSAQCMAIAMCCGRQLGSVRILPLCTLTSLH